MGRSQLVVLGGLVAGLASVWPATMLRAQQWDALLTVDPFPSPYLSDWELDPTLGQLTITNFSNATTDVTIHYTLARNGLLLLRGFTDPQMIPAGQSVVFDGTSTVGGEADWDVEFERLLMRTGRIPEGEYEGCVTVADPVGLVLVDRVCVRFSALYPDPPFLIYPFDRDTVTSQDPIFEWQPVQIPGLSGLRVGYVLAIAEVNTAAGQIPTGALESNILHYFEPDLSETYHQYPVGALPLVPGRTYAWRVQALDGDGLPVAANLGRSEVWTFVYSEPEVDPNRRVALIELSAGRDTLRYAGDTLRIRVVAYDEDNLEIRNPRLSWRSVDTTVVKVDSSGIVTSVGAGEARIVAWADDAADSLLTVALASAGFRIGFDTYDAENEPPSLLDLIQSGSFEEVVPQLLAKLEAGDFRLPMPRIAGVAQNGTAGSSSCSSLSLAGQPVVDNAKRTFTVRLAASRSDQQAIQHECLGVSRQAVDVAAGPPAGVPGLPVNPPGGPPGEHPGPPTEPPTEPPVEPPVEPPTETPEGPSEDDDGIESGVDFVASWDEAGRPYVYVAIKGPGVGLFDLEGLRTLTMFLVINLTRPFSANEGPDPDFFGGESFPVGVGLTFFWRSRCETGRDTGLCNMLRAINEEEPDITVQAFAGVTASETSVDVEKGVGSSLALGFSIQAALPVRKSDFVIHGPGEQQRRLFSLDSLQVALLFAIQDSIVQARGQDVDHSWSVGLAPALTVWWSGPGNQWAFTFSIGYEYDISSGAHKIVAFLEIPAVWQFWALRLGNPTIVFTLQRDLIELALSGTWGVGPNEGFGVSEGGGGVRGDIGGAGGGGGFEELGRGALHFKWTPMPPPPPATGRPFGPLTREQQERYGEGTRPRADARAERTQAEGQQTVPWHMQNPPQPATPAMCSWTTSGGKCVSWTARLSIGNGSLLDLLSLIRELWREES